MIPTESDPTRLRLQMLKDFENDAIDRLIDGVTLFTARESANLASHAEKIQTGELQHGIDKTWILALLEDDRCLLDEIDDMIHELAIVGLHKKIEMTTRRAVQAVYPDLPENLLFDAKKLRKHLKEEGIDIKSLPHHAAIDEVRCLSRDIQRGSMASAKLATYPGWTKDEPLQDINHAYARLAPQCTHYVQELIDNLIEKSGEILSPPDDVFDFDDSATE